MIELKTLIILAKSCSGHILFKNLNQKDQIYFLCQKYTNGQFPQHLSFPNFFHLQVKSGYDKIKLTLKKINSDIL